MAVAKTFLGCVCVLFHLLVTIIAADEETETFFFKILCGKTTHTRKVFGSEVATGVFKETRSLQFQTKWVKRFASDSVTYTKRHENKFAGEAGFIRLSLWSILIIDR